MSWAINGFGDIGNRQNDKHAWLQESFATHFDMSTRGSLRRRTILIL